MKVSVIGTGYVGLVVGACLSEMGNDVICVDNKIKVNVNENRLTFTDNLKYAVQNSLVCYIAVGTPQGEDGSADLKYVYQVAESIGESINGYKVIVDKSTVPVGTADKVTEIIKSKTN